MTILALDLATTTGFAIGAPGETPRCGSIKLGDSDSSEGAIAAKAIEWTVDFLSVTKPRMVVYEAPLPPSFVSGHTNFKASKILLGLPFLICGVAYRMGIYNLRSARVSDVRRFFIGSHMKSGPAEKLTMKRCQAFGWNPESHDAADALALWAYQVSIESPEHGVRLSPLFGGALLQG